MGGVRTMSYYHAVSLKLDRDQIEEYPNGVCVQEIELVLTDNPERPYWLSTALEPAVCAIDARRARELASQLVALAALAEHAEQWEQAR
jgi:hypothetical protein